MAKADLMYVLNGGEAHVEDIVSSPAHFDHVGNSRLFPHAMWYVQESEHDAMFGTDPDAHGGSTTTCPRAPRSRTASPGRSAWRMPVWP